METIFLIVNSILLLGILLVVFLKKTKTDKTPFVELQAAMKEGLADTRKEFREVNAENRKEINDLFKGLQDTVLNRISENITLQKNQLDSFSKLLTELKDKLIDSAQKSNDAISHKQNEFTEKTGQKFTDFEKNLKDDAKTNREELAKGLKSFEDKFAENIKDFNEQLRQKFSDLSKQQQDFNTQSKQSIKEMQEGVEKQLKSIREDNTTQLNEMRKTVDEKLQTTLEKRLGESFKQVSDRLEQVHKGLGEMQNLATGVGDLKKVLSNVKTRGILGEYQLENILEQMLTPQQYAKNVATKKGSQANVEFAVKMPGKSDDDTVWMPVDSKFPVESYQLLLDAYDTGLPENIEVAQKALLKAIDGFAKDISQKYLDPPHTTNFGIMFLPVESLYAEVLRHPGLFEKLQNDYKITVTGPTTLAALLNSLSMGFRTLAVQKRSSEVWNILSAVKTEFSEFTKVLSIAHKQINTASSTLDKLRTTRTNQMKRKLKEVHTIEVDSKNILELPDAEFEMEE
ncbi:DNA recombination protein RmuC [Sunxiuqinia rutila]|uniref:DNA recombination protein RmuC n=1 Tax=Sunxiuqinia rutila TaxID=1397841 RepID=UPI003D36AE0D